MSDFQVNPRTKSQGSGAVAGRVFIAFVLFGGGLLLLGTGASGGNPSLDPYVFVAGLVAICLSFGLPMIGAHER